MFFLNMLDVTVVDDMRTSEAEDFGGDDAL